MECDMKKCSILIMIFLCMFAVRGFAAQKLDEESLQKKKRGWYATPSPLLSFYSDNGLGYGACVYVYNNGKDEDKGFDETPYFTRIYGQFYQTTKGWSQHQICWDQYRLFNTSLRIRAAVVYEKKLNANYFGVGSKTTHDNLEDSDLTTHKTWKHYYKRFLKDDYLFFTQGNWWHFISYKYDNYMYVEPMGYLNLIGKFAEDIPVIKDFEYLVGFQVQHMSIRRWDNHGYRVNGRRFVEFNPTRLTRERPQGHQGGWSNFIRVGLAYDSLDYEPDPTKGIRAEYCVETSQRFFGSDYVYYRNTLGFRWYQTWFKGFTHVLRLAYTTSAHNMPFFDLNRFAFFWNRETGLGGPRTLRGYKNDRFVGKTMTLANFELRYHIGDIVIPVLGRFGFKIIGFVEAGNVYDKSGYPFVHPRWRDYKYCYGGGVVVPWNQATIMHCYVGFSSEDYAISLDFEHGIR